MTYTVYNTLNSSEVHGHNLSAVEAMREILTYDGYDYRIEKNEEDRGFYDLKVSSGSRNGTTGLGRFKTIQSEIVDSEEEAEAAFAKFVIEHSGGDWSRLEAVTTERYFADQITLIEENIEYMDDDEKAEAEASIRALAAEKAAL